MTDSTGNLSARSEYARALGAFDMEMAGIVIGRAESTLAASSMLRSELDESLKLLRDPRLTHADPVALALGIVDEFVRGSTSLMTRSLCMSIYMVGRSHCGPDSYPGLTLSRFGPRTMQPSKPTRKVVLVSNSGYDPAHDHILRDLIDEQIALFCAVGRDCVLWEEVMDELIVGPDGSGETHILTTSHPDESVPDVISFAEGLDVGQPSGVRVIEV